MATLTVTNLTTSPVYCRDLYATLAASGTITTTRYASDLSRMDGLQALVAAGTVSVSVQYSATEQAAGIALNLGLPQGSATGTSEDEIVRVPLVAGAGGSPDDVTVYAAGALPAAKMRILDAYVEVATAVGSSKIQVRTAITGGGTLCAECNTAATGRNGQTATVTASQVITNGGSVGLFVHRSDNGIGGEVFITMRPEV